VGRKNRKGRTGRQDPSRFHREKKNRRAAPAEPDAAGGTFSASESTDGNRGSRRRRRSGATDAVDGIMEAAFGDQVRGDGFVDLEREAGSGRRRKAAGKKASQRAGRAAPQSDGPGPLWLVDAAHVRSLPSPSGSSDVIARPAKSAICGNCREWVPPADPHASDRGRCIHPASGVSRPPAEFEGCSFFG
jgi:hypothetical protein